MSAKFCEFLILQSTASSSLVWIWNYHYKICYYFKIHTGGAEVHKFIQW